MGTFIKAFLSFFAVLFAGAVAIVHRLFRILLKSFVALKSAFEKREKEEEEEEEGQAALSLLVAVVGIPFAVLRAIVDILFEVTEGLAETLNILASTLVGVVVVPIAVLFDSHWSDSAVDAIGLGRHVTKMFEDVRDGIRLFRDVEQFVEIARND